MATLRQKKAIEKLVETRGNVTEAMRLAGYPEGTVNNPSVLTKSKAFLELFDDVLPDEVLAERHRAFLNSDREEIGVKALDMAYKVKSHYAPDKSISLNLEATATDKVIEQLANALEIHERTNQPGDGITPNAVDKEVPDKD